MSFTLLISLIALVVSIICIVLLILLFKRCLSQFAIIGSQSDLLLVQTKKLTILNDELHEIRSGNYGVISRVKELVKQVEKLELAQQNFVEQDSQSRFYSKGAKLISQGASLEEVMRECDMPSAEAELLFNLHSRQ